jgi:VWFA-related protein
MRALLLAAATTLLSTLAISAQQPAPPATPQVPKPTFETKAEIVLVDVNVVDRDAKPVATLTEADFELEVNGQPRKLQSVQFISTTASNVTPSTPRESAYSSNESQTTGRLLLFVVDESSLRAGANRSVLRAAQSLFDRLAPGDLVGLARLPTGIGGVEFTENRKRITDGLMKITGAPATRGINQVYLSEAWGLENNDEGAFQNAVTRECSGMSGPDLEACRNSLEGDARNLILEASSRARATLQSLESLLKNLAQLKMPVNIILMSEGMFVARDRVSMTALGRLAAEARSTIHVIRPSQNFYDVENRGLSSTSTRFFDDGLMAEGLEQVAGQTRGSMSTVNGDGKIAFDRLGRELSGYYLIGFEPTEADRTGRERRIKVEVKTRGLTVRARPTFLVPATAVAEKSPLTPMQELGEVLKSPLPMRGLPMRVATYLAPETGSNKVRVVISAEVGEPANTPAEWPVGVIVLDKNDKIVVNRGGMSTLQPAGARGPDTPRLLLTSVALEPGEYTLRLAAVDDTGRGGSVHHTVTARLNRMPSGINVSDLMLAPQPAVAGELPRPRPTTVIDNEVVSAMLELTGPDQGLLGKTKVTLQISDADNGNALVNVEAKQVQRGNVRAFAAQMRLGVLPPGEYIARAIVAPPGQPEMRVTRAFMLAPVAEAEEPAPDFRVPLDPDAPPAPIAASKILAPIPRFSARTILVPEVVQPFLEGLADMHPPSPEVEAIVEKAKNGTYEVPAERGASADDELNLAFVRGLSALSRNEVAQAAAWFQQTLKGASDFLGAAFYLGATHAVSGRDREAIGAWQMALLSENPGAVYPALVDALLRTGDGRQALDVLEEAPSAWPNDNERLKREAIALAMLGDFGSALPKLKDQLDNNKGDDQPLLFVAIQVLYRMHQQDKSLSSDNLNRFRSYVERHQKLGGPDRAIVETWRRAVLGR